VFYIGPQLRGLGLYRDLIKVHVARVREHWIVHRGDQNRYR